MDQDLSQRIVRIYLSGFSPPRFLARFPHMSFRPLSRPCMKYSFPNNVWSAAYHTESSPWTLKISSFPNIWPSQYPPLEYDSDAKISRTMFELGSDKKRRLQQFQAGHPANVSTPFSKLFLYYSPPMIQTNCVEIPPNPPNPSQFTKSPLPPPS